MGCMRASKSDEGRNFHLRITVQMTPAPTMLDAMMMRIVTVVLLIPEEVDWVEAPATPVVLALVPELVLAATGMLMGTDEVVVAALVVEAGAELEGEELVAELEVALEVAEDELALEVADELAALEVVAAAALVVVTALVVAAAEVVVAAALAVVVGVVVSLGSPAALPLPPPRISKPPALGSDAELADESARSANGIRL